MAHFLDAPVRDAQARALVLADTAVVFRRRDLLAAGIPDAIQSAMYRRGLLVRLRHGVYVLSQQIDGATPAELHRVHLAAAIAAADEPTWGFGASAALIHGLPLPFEVPAHVELLRQARQDERSLARPSRHRLSLPSVRITTHAIAAHDVTDVGGIAVVSAPLAAVAAARTLAHRWQVALCDAALWNGTVTSEDLSRLNEEWRSRCGKAQLDAAIARARRGAQSVLETFSRLALVDQGLPEPQLQVAFHDRGGLIGYVDMCWADLRVVGEADGRVKYSSRDDLVREKMREDRLRALGFRVVRWMWEDIHERPAEIAGRIRARHRMSA